MRYIVRGKDGESGIWWSWQDLRKKEKRQGFCTHGRAWLYFPRHNAEICWNLGDKSCGAYVEFSDIGDDAITLHFAIPLLLSFWFSIGGRVPFINKLPGVKWNGKWGSGERKIGWAIHHWTFWIYPWIHDDGKWWSFHIDDFLFGKQKYSDQNIETGTVGVVLPESTYQATYRLFRSTWTWPRWRQPRHLLRGEIEVENGVPIPGKGENSWDLEDTLTYSLTCPAGSKEELVEKFIAGIVKRRKDYGWQHEQG